MSHAVAGTRAIPGAVATTASVRSSQSPRSGTNSANAREEPHRNVDARRRTREGASDKRTPHVLFLGLAFLDGSQLTIDVAISTAASFRAGAMRSM